MDEKERVIWKAKHQRRMTDEQIAFFLDRHPRYDLLTWYSYYAKHGMTEQEALDEVIARYGKE